MSAHGLACATLLVMEIVINLLKSKSTVENKCSSGSIFDICSVRIFLHKMPMHDLKRRYFRCYVNQPIMHRASEGNNQIKWQQLD